ncbi:hypothetical protein K439DRAFT_1410528 [Ramaria rubella]|nr:hypothetical protein K439DRAFT_1410528 [Ramaria rubella]
MITHFKDDYEYAEVLKENGSLDLSETPECAMCHKEDAKCMLCAACKAIFYCTTECAKAGWNDRIIQDGGVAPGHKIMCQQNKEQMSKVDELQAILKQFPWARIEKDGSFRSHLVLASRGILGTGKNFGFWSEEPCCDEHGLDSYEWGVALLRPDLPDEKTGWMLPDAEIPWLKFDENLRPPPFPPKFEHTWRSYYEWRGLPLSSPAALLLHWPLSIYQLLTKLRLVPNLSETKSEERHKLLLHYVGVEEELDYLPVFGELALLLPNTDVELVLFGTPAYMILHSARQITDSSSVISKSEDDIVYTYNAPEECGSGTIRIVLWGGGPTWTPELLRFGAPVPDAIIGLNAGLGSFQEWQSAIVSSRAFNIPFAITDFMEASLELNRGLVNQLTVELPEEASEWIKETYGEEGETNLRRINEMPSEINPFMRPGQKLGGAWSRLPAAINGFTFVVTPNVHI